MKSPSVLPLNEDVSHPGAPIPRPVPVPMRHGEAAAWLRWAWFWLLVSSLLGLAMCVCEWLRWAGVGVSCPPVVPYMFRLAFLPGWGWMALFAAFLQWSGPGSGAVSSVARLLRDGWNMLIAVALCSVWAGAGSGSWWMPAAPWLMPCFALLAVGCCFVVGWSGCRSGGAVWKQSVVAVSFAMASGLWVASWMFPWDPVRAWAGWGALLLVGCVPMWLLLCAGKRGGVVPAMLVWGASVAAMFCLPWALYLVYPLAVACAAWFVAAVWFLWRARQRRSRRGDACTIGCVDDWRAGCLCAVTAVLVVAGGMAGSGKVESGDAGVRCSEGSRVFAAQGCLLCHGCGEMPSVTAQGPCLDGLPSRVMARVCGEERMVASPREWLYLHVYNPRDKVWGKETTVCPAMPGLFVAQARASRGGAAEALPLRVPEGREVVPSPEAVALAYFLLALSPDASAEDAGLQASAAVQEARGKRLYLAKCAVCHGRDGKGDAVNYPPLAGSEWLVQDDVKLRDIIRNGLEGKITVKGREWDSAMLAPGVTKPEDAEAIIRYVKKVFAVSQ